MYFKSFNVPAANSTDNVDMKDVAGNKTDTAVTTVGTDKSLMAYTKGILNSVLTLIGEDFDVKVYGPQKIDVDNTARFEVVIVDKTSGLIPSANITAGTYKVIRTRAGADTEIVAASAWSKANGKVYLDYTFAIASWATDDEFKVESQGDTTITIGTNTYYVGIPTFSGFVENVSATDAAIAAIQTDIGDPSARGNLKSLESMLGNPDVASATLYANVGDFFQQSNLKSLLAVMGSGWNTANKDLYTGLVTDRLDNAGFGLSALNTDLDALLADIGDFSARVNLSSLLTTLGVPDVAGKSLYTCLITDRLDSATYGLSALNTDLDAILADLGDASASTLGSVYAILGNPGTQAINTQLGYGAAGSVAADLTVVKAALAGTETVSSMSYLDAGGEQDVIVLSPGAGEQWIVHGIWLDTSAMTQNGTAKIYYKVDNSNYVLCDSEALLSTDTGSWLPLNMGITSDFKITYTESVDETADRTIYYQAIYEVR